MRVLPITLVAWVIGRLVTDRLIGAGGWWSKPVTVMFVRANLPVGGAAALLVAIVVPAIRVEAAAVSAGFTIAAIAGGRVDPAG